jgi:hypothetical protein
VPLVVPYSSPEEVLTPTIIPTTTIAMTLPFNNGDVDYGLGIFRVLEVCPDWF